MLFHADDRGIIANLPCKAGQVQIADVQLPGLADRISIFNTAWILLADIVTEEICIPAAPPLTVVPFIACRTFSISVGNSIEIPLRSRAQLESPH